MSHSPVVSPASDARQRAGAAPAPHGSMRAASDWTAPGEIDASAFGASMLDALRSVATARATPDGRDSAFDVCQSGVVLRAVLLVQGAIALAVGYSAGEPATWVLSFAGASVGGIAAVLSWLVASCLTKRWLSALAPAGQWAAAIGLGAACGVFGWALLRFGGLGSAAPTVGLAACASGAALAGLFFYWLRQRALARLPADTTARLAELQSRIRPHFLFNTLNTAVTLVRVDPARAEAVLEDLAELFRVALTAPGAVATLAEEVELAQRYLAIEQLRFGERLRVAWEIEPESVVAKLPPLLLQPLLENAVRHGIEPSAAGGSIRVRARVRRGRAVIDVVNTLGTAASTPGHGIALQNVRERLRLMHDVEAQFDAQRDGALYRVQIVVPLA